MALNLDAPRPDVVVLVPCYNEEITISKVVSGFRESLPDARVYVYDNNSTDSTVAVARASGAIVRGESRQGKGNVVRRMLGDVDADVYILVDGDDTYEAAGSTELVRKVWEEGFDLVNGARIPASGSPFPSGHVMGNRLLGGLVTKMFRRQAGDMLSGYKAFSRRFVKSFPGASSGFEIETELTVHAMSLEMPTAEVKLPYRERPEGSDSKLSTYRDGMRIVRTITGLLRSERPMAFFSMIGALLMLVSVVLGVPLLITFHDTHTVPRFPTAILCTGLIVVSFLAFACGLILDTVTKGRRESKTLAYLATPAPRTMGGFDLLEPDRQISLSDASRSHRDIARTP